MSVEANKKVIVFENVSKTFPFYGHIRRGIKGFICNLPQALKDMKNGRFVALRDISFEIERGQSVGIIGRNGEGKSTILSLIAGVIRPTTGTVRVEGKVFPILELGSGFHPDLTGRENIILNGVLLGLTRSEMRAQLNDIIEFSELGEFIDQPIRTYSTGMIARLGFSVVLAAKPDILLVDEVLAVGDIAFQKKCFHKMLRFKEDGATIVFVSHDMTAVRNMCEKVIWIENHTVKRIGKPEEVIEEYIRRISP
jgi:lipopolysaccharide transport system ATP-binding protein